VLSEEQLVIFLNSLSSYQHLLDHLTTCSGPTLSNCVEEMVEIVPFFAGMEFIFFIADHVML